MCRAAAATPRGRHPRGEVPGFPHCRSFVGGRSAGNRRPHRSDGCAIGCAIGHRPVPRGRCGYPAQTAAGRATAGVWSLTRGGSGDLVCLLVHTTWGFDVTAATAGSGAAPVKKEKRPIPGFAQLQRVGRSLMLPIASLPAAALLLRLGQPDMLGEEGVASWSGMGWVQPVADVLGAAGDALIGNLPILFAIGVAIGFARKSDGSTALAALVGYLVFTAVLGVMAPMSAPWGDTFGSEAPGSCAETVAEAGLDPADFECAASTYKINYGVLGGITIGSIAAVLYQRYYRIKLPTYLAFFGGRRFVPIITAVSAVVTAVVFAFVYPVFDRVITGFGDWVTDPGNAVLGGFVFGTANRLLIPLGLHHPR